MNREKQKNKGHKWNINENHRFFFFFKPPKVMIHSMWRGWTHKHNTAACVGVSGGDALQLRVLVSPQYLWNAPVTEDKRVKREIMVCMIVFVTADGDTLPEWRCRRWLCLHNLRKPTESDHSSMIANTLCLISLPLSACRGLMMLSNMRRVVVHVNDWRLNLNGNFHLCNVKG